MKYILAIFILLTTVLVVSAILNKPDKINTSGKMKIATTIFPLYDIAKNIAGDRVTVINILPPGGSPHTFEVTPSTIKELQGTSLVFTIGDPLDTWATIIATNIGNITLKPVNEHIDMQPFTSEHSHENKTDKYANEEGEEEIHDQLLDPHYWLDTENAKIIAANIAAELSRLNPEYTDYYQANLNAYQTKLDATHQQINELLQDLKHRELIVFHESWNYFAREFDLKIAGVFTAAPGQEPTPQQLKTLQQTAMEHNIHTLFSEPQLSPETIKPLVEDLRLSLYVLDPLGGMDDRDSFINTLLYNAHILNQALNE